MASIAAMPPTPQQSFTNMASAGSPPGPSTQPNGVPAYGHSYSMSFDSQHSQPVQSHSQPIPTYNQSFPNGPVSNPGYVRSFEGRYPAAGYGEKPQIYTAVYSGVSVYEMEIQGIACMRRRDDGWLNATQILKVAGVDKGKRTKVLEKEILTGEHEKVQGGYGKYQGTWISYRRGREFCRQYGVEDILKPLLDYDVTADGSGGQGQETPTKEQAMAANRKRFYNPNLDGRPAGGPMTNGTFFQNISPTTSVALAAMNKAARLNSPAPRPASAQRPSNMRRPSQQDGFPGGSQQSMASDASFNLDGKYDSAYSTQPNSGEPPRKRMRGESQDGMAPPALPIDASMRSVTPTEPNESFVYDGAMSREHTHASSEPVALVPLPSPTTDEEQEKMNLILELFAGDSRADYSSHDAFTKLSGEDFNMPLDASANNALHWAATLARVPLLKLLVQKGANIWRGNAAGQSPLISAVLVNNCWEHSCFPELLELLGPLIEVRDLQGRTILHHIAVSSGIKGRAPSSKYYLEALLEFLVRIGTQANSAANASAMPSLAAAAEASIQASQQANGEVLSQDSATLPPTQPWKGAVSLVRFLSHVVNARDKAGNTALNLVARIGNRSIIQQLLEIHADPILPNYKGVSARDFGVGIDSSEQPHLNGEVASQQSVQAYQTMQEPAVVDRDGVTGSGSGSQVEDLSLDVISSMTSMLTQNLASHKDLLRERTEQIDRLNNQIREFSALQTADLDRLQDLKDRVKLRGERQAKVMNLKRAIQQRRVKKLPPAPAQGNIEPRWLDESGQEVLNFETTNGSPNGLQRQFLENNIPSPPTLRARLNAYLANNASLQKQADELKSRSSELESMYRKVVSLCTGVAEEKVEESLPALVAAVESERGGLGEQEVGRVRDFLRRVDGAAGVAAVES